MSAAAVTRKSGDTAVFAERKGKDEKLEAARKEAAAKWNACDQKIIASLGLPILISGNHPPKSNVVLGLNVDPRSTLAEIKPLFDRRIAALSTKRDAAQAKYEALGRELTGQEAEEQAEAFELGLKFTGTSFHRALKSGGILDQQNTQATIVAQLQAEIDVLTIRFQPAQEIYDILQKV